MRIELRQGPAGLIISGFSFHANSRSPTQLPRVLLQSTTSVASDTSLVVAASQLFPSSVSHYTLLRHVRDDVIKQYSRSKYDTWLVQLPGHSNLSQSGWLTANKIEHSVLPCRSPRCAIMYLSQHTSYATIPQIVFGPKNNCHQPYPCAGSGLTTIDDGLRIEASLCKRRHSLRLMAV